MTSFGISRPDLFNGSFGQNFLMKMGWKEGSGLGKNSTGPTTCLIGYKQERFADDNSCRDWFEKVFDATAENIKIGPKDQNSEKKPLSSISPSALLSALGKNSIGTSNVKKTTLKSIDENTDDMEQNVSEVNGSDLKLKKKKRKRCEEGNILNFYQSEDGEKSQGKNKRKKEDDKSNDDDNNSNNNNNKRNNIIILSNNNSDNSNENDSSHISTLSSSTSFSTPSPSNSPSPSPTLYISTSPFPSPSLSPSASPSPSSSLIRMSDEELLAMVGGCLARSHNPTAKLSRIAAQDRKYKEGQKSSSSGGSRCSSQKKERKDSEQEKSGSSCNSSSSGDGSSDEKKRKKKDRGLFEGKVQEITDEKKKNEDKMEEER